MIVVTYHKIHDRFNFEKQIHFFVRNFNVLSLDAFIEIGKGDNGFAKNDVLITFDDGDYTVYENAFPILKKYNCPAVLFVITSVIGTNEPFWWDEIAELDKGNNKVKQVKKVSNQERLDYLKVLRTKSKPIHYRQLTVDELKEMESHKIAICNHTHNHPLLDQCNDDEVRKEFELSKLFLISNGFKHYNVFAYPNGNFNSRVEAIMVESDISCAFLFDHQLNKKQINPHQISRLSVNDKTPLWKLRLIVNGWHSKFLPTIKKLYSVLR